MELLDGTLKLDTFLTVTLGIVVLFIGKQLNLSLIHISSPRDRTRSRMPSSA